MKKPPESVQYYAFALILSHSLLSGNSLFNNFSNKGIVQTKTSTPKILNSMWALANVLSMDASPLIFFTN
jgi:hypothetical protein